jgi:hypothetical protein
MRLHPKRRTFFVPDLGDRLHVDRRSFTHGRSELRGDWEGVERGRVEP